MQAYIRIIRHKGAPMLLSFITAFLRAKPRFVWRPAVDMRDRTIFSTLLPGTQY